jgi:D-alanyl-D-alanine carboxypeptidase (penicillin-binding protein 5/6)
MLKQAGVFISLLALFCSAGGALAFAVDGVFSRVGDEPALSAKAAVVMDAATSAIIFAKNPDEEIPPASLAKLMTMHVALTLATERRVSLDTAAPVPPAGWAENQPPRSSLMYLERGEVVTLRELLLGMAIPSGNDAAVAVALRFAPSVSAFAALMNNAAENLGMTRTYFVEPSGVSENNITTAHDFALFCQRYLALHPDVLKDFHSVGSFAFPTAANMPSSRRATIATRVFLNHVGLVGVYPGADGIKTGFIDESGYNIASTASREGTRFIAVVLGVPASEGAYWGPIKRDADARALLDWAFSRYKTLRVAYPTFPTAHIWKGSPTRAAVVPYIAGQTGANFGAYTTRVNRGKHVTYTITMKENLIAPLPAGATAGTVAFTDDTGVIGSADLRVPAAIARGNFFRRVWDSIVMFFLNIKAD